MKNSEIFKVRDLAALLRVAEKTVYTMAQTGELPAFKVRGQWRFAKQDIDDWIENQKRMSHEVDKGEGQ